MWEGKYTVEEVPKIPPGLVDEPRDHVPECDHAFQGSVGIDDIDSVDVLRVEKRDHLFHTLVPLAGDHLRHPRRALFVLLQVVSHRR